MGDGIGVGRDVRGEDCQEGGRRGGRIMRRKDMKEGMR